METTCFTFPEFEGQGVATRIVQALIQIAFSGLPELKIAARNLPEENTWAAVLKKLCFQFIAGWSIMKVAKPGNGS